MARRQESKPALTKAELVRAVQDQVGLSHGQAAAMVDQLFETIKDALVDEADGQVKISGFGTFHVAHAAARLARNPRTMEDVMIEERRVLRFRCSQLLRVAMNKELRR